MRGKYDNNNKFEIDNDGTMVRYDVYDLGFNLGMFSMYNSCRYIR